MYDIVLPARRLLHKSTEQTLQSLELVESWKLCNVVRSRMMVQFSQQQKTNYAEISVKRYKSQVYDNDTVADNGMVDELKGKIRKVNPKGQVPNTIFSFNNCGALRGKPQNKHPAPFHPDLPRLFINWLTNKGDIVLDPYMGSGTTAAVCKEMERNYIGFELNDTYKSLIEESLN